MAIENFAECYATRVETTVDAVIDDIRSLGADGIHAVVNWWSGLSETSKDLIKASGLASAVLVAILKKSFNMTTAGALTALLGGASWALLIIAFTDCAHLL